MINALVIDDERHAIDRLCGLIQQRCAHLVQVAGTALNVQEGIAAIDRLLPDLVFLDVHLHHVTGFDLLNRVDRQNKPFDVIFTTAYSEYAVQAFKFSAIDYLLKPIDADDLEQAVNKVAHKNEKAGADLQLAALMHNLQALQSANRRLCIPVANGLEFVHISDIVRCESEINYTHIFMTDRRKLLIPKTLKEFEDMLSPYDFYRVHNSHLVNLRYVKSYTRGKGGYITMHDNTTIGVSTRRKDDFLKRLASL
jgi:Response regulator of the LytR/AlgR family